MDIHSGSNDTDKLWTVKQLRQDKRCGFCFSENLNSWMACIRKSSMINLHIGFISRTRQALLLALQMAKFLPIPDNYSGEYFRFFGPLTKIAEPTDSRSTLWQPKSFKNPGVRIESDKTINPNLPQARQQLPVYAYGKYNK